MLRLYSFAHSSASWRVRIALALKGLAHEVVAVSLVKDGGEHKAAAYRAVNPHGRVPALETPDGVLFQSLAIMDWLEETHPAPSLYPAGAFERARCRAFAQAIASDIFPLQNLGARQKLGRDFGADADAQARWSAQVIEAGFAGLEEELSRRGGLGPAYLFGAAPTLADICLVPQMNNARRYGADLSRVPLLVEADARARAHPAFVRTAPETQAG
jgi:maleylpyruvate isomerase